MEHYVAVDNVCAWPNLTRLADGGIAAVIFNQPCHGKWEGDVECWVSSDGGKMWQQRGVPAPHEPETNRMNVAAGLAADGSFLVLSSGWSDKPKTDKVADQPFRSEILAPWVCCSNDDGKTWERIGEIRFENVGPLIPFGDIVPGPDGSLNATAYSQGNVLFLTSRDNGKTWNYVPLVEDGRHNETDILHAGGRNWIAASRTADERNLDLFVSDNNGADWCFQRMLTGPEMHPAHLLPLQDGRILLSFGIRFRNCRGVGVRISDDQGTSWSRISVITSLPGAKDCGYPSSVQLEDGTVVTAWYANGTTAHHRYHMGVTRWQLNEI